MFPTLLPFIDRHPRFATFIGFSVFVLVAILWLAARPVSYSENKSLFSSTSKIEQQALLKAPDAANPEAVAQYAEYIEDYAVETETISISANCVMDPLIIKLKASATLKIENRDSVKHIISFEDQNFFSMAAGQVREFNVSEKFQKGPGIYRYRCNDISNENNVGVMYFIE